MEGRVYLSYERYAEMGGKLPEEDYEIAERKARALLDDWTLDRIKRLDEVPEEVELAMFEVIERIGPAFDGNGGVASFSNGVNSVSFNASADVRGELYDIVAAILPVELISAAVHFNVR